VSLKRPKREIAVKINGTGLLQEPKVVIKGGGEEPKHLYRAEKNSL
jgi:hypothetical protein